LYVRQSEMTAEGSRLPRKSGVVSAARLSHR
jgi:hypothetical protein